MDSFGRFGPFQWVTANPNKNFPFSISGSAKGFMDQLIRPSTPSQKRSVPDQRRRIRIAQILNYEKESLRRVRLQPADRETNSGTGALTLRSDAGLFRPALGGIGEPQKAAPGAKMDWRMHGNSHAGCSIHSHFSRFSLALGSKPNHAWQINPGLSLSLNDKRGSRQVRRCSTGCPSRSASLDSFRENDSTARARHYHPRSQYVRAPHRIARSVSDFRPTGDLPGMAEIRPKPTI